MTPFAPKSLTGRCVGWLCQMGALNKAVLAVSGFLALMVFADAPMRDFAARLDPVLKRFFQAVTNIGDSFWPILACLLLLPLLYGLEKRRKGRGDKTVLRYLRGLVGFVLFSVAGSGIIASLVKNSIGRGRPSNPEITGILDFTPFAFHAPWASFPSGHSTTSLALATGLAILFPRQAVALYCIGIWGAASRVFIGVHWVSDAVAGACLGVIFVFWLRQKYASKGLIFPTSGRKRAVLPGWVYQRLARILREEAKRVGVSRR